jgi:small nuclear ribonucleoprotein (snRNP)-like protein
MARRDRLVRQALRERFIVTLRSGESFDGVLMDIDEKTLRMLDATALDGRNRALVDGQLYLPRDQVVYLQRPDGARA